MIFLVIRQWRN